MKTFFKKERYLYGPALPLLNNKPWNPALHPRNDIGEFIYTDGGLHGRSASISTPSNKTAKDSIQATVLNPADYRRIAADLLKTDKIPPNSQKFKAPDGETFWAPAGADFQAIYNAGKANGLFNEEGYEKMKKAVWQYGKYDFQRNMGGGYQFNADNIFYSAYTHASNYAVGVYMNGAGASLWQTLSIAWAAALKGSKNAGSPDLPKWQGLGWQAAQAQKSQWRKSTK